MSQTLHQPLKPALDVQYQRSTRHHTSTPLIGKGIRIIVLLAFAIFFGVPIIWLFLAPTRMNAQLLSGPSLAFGSFHNVAVAWGHLLQYNNGEIMSWIMNTVIYTVGALIISVCTCIPAGFALATTQFRGRYLLLIATLVAMIIPGSATVLPLFMEISSVHMLDTIWSVILPTSFFPFGVYLTYIYFATSLPGEMLDAGRVDGCSQWQLFWRLGVPLASPIISLVVFFSFVANWNNYFLPFVMLTKDSNYNLPVGLEALFNGAPGLLGTFATEIPIYGPEEALAGAIVVLPILIIFLFSQRYLVAGIFGGSTKG